MNFSDAERVARVLEKLGFERTENLDEADLFLIFSCVVRQKAEDRIFGEIEKLTEWKSAKSGRRIGLTGCAVRRTSDRESARKDAFLRRAPKLDFTFQIAESEKLPELLAAETTNYKLQTTNYLEIDPARRNRRQVFVPISTGCDNFCSYCVVPYARGREISRDPTDILAECERAVANGAREITLLGQNVNSFRKKSGAFADLLDRVAAIPNLRRVRFTSSHPKDFDESVIAVLARNPNIERHLHLPAQHGDSEILARMNRNYSAAEYLELLAKFREKLPNASVTSDFIVGFPGESEKNFGNLLEFYERADFDFAFLAQYSPRLETPAATFPNQIAPAVKKERFEKLNNLILTTTARKLAKIKNRTLEVLVEKCGCHSRESGKQEKNKICAGRSSEFFAVKFPGAENLVGEFVKIKITRPREVELFGEIR